MEKGSGQVRESIRGAMRICSAVGQGWWVRRKQPSPTPGPYSGGWRPTSERGTLPDPLAGKGSQQHPGERGHDALLIEAPVEEIEQAVAECQWASSLVLNGFRLRTDAKVVRYPDRYMDPRGQRMWNTVFGLLDRPGAAHVG
jgi:hypothetical protein